MAAPLVTFRQMVPGLSGMKRIFDSHKDILNFNGVLIYIFLIDVQAAPSAFPYGAVLLTSAGSLVILPHSFE